MKNIHIDKYFYMTNAELDYHGVREAGRRNSLCGQKSALTTLWRQVDSGIVEDSWTPYDEPTCETCVILYLVEKPKAQAHAKRYANQSKKGTCK